MMYLLMLALSIHGVLVQAQDPCLQGFKWESGKCVDINECEENEHLCQPPGDCSNTEGSYSCKCHPGFKSIRLPTGEMCADEDECADDTNPCLPGGTCHNFYGSYSCNCHPGYEIHHLGTGEEFCTAPDNSGSDTTSGEVATTPSASPQPWMGYSTWTTTLAPMTLLNFERRLSVLRDIIPGPAAGKGNQALAEKLMKDVLNITNGIQQPSSGLRGNSTAIGQLLSSVEKTVWLISTQLTQNVTRIAVGHTELAVVLSRDDVPPRGPLALITGDLRIDTTWESVTGQDASSSGSGTVYAFLLSYKDPAALFPAVDCPVSGVATVGVSNPNTSKLPEPLNITFTHLQPRDPDLACVYWSEQGSGRWSTQGCTKLLSNQTHTVCSCDHLSSFSLIKGVRKKGLSTVMLVGGSVAASCVVLSLLVTVWCRRIRKKKHGGRRSRPI